MWSLSCIASQLESPFDGDGDSLDLKALQHEQNERLLCLISMDVRRLPYEPQRLERSPASAGTSSVSFNDTNEEEAEDGPENGVDSQAAAASRARRKLQSMTEEGPPRTLR